MNNFEDKNQFLEVTEYQSTDASEHITRKNKKSRGFTFKKVIALTLIISILGGLSIGAGIALTNNYVKSNNYQGLFNESSSTFSNEESKELISSYNEEIKNNPIVKIAEEVGPSVVAITSKVNVTNWFNNPYTQEAMGSGVIFDINSENILILTNNHVIDGAEELMVTLGEDSDAPAEVVGEDQSTDLAIIKIAKTDLDQEILKEIKAATFGDSHSLSVGEPAIAIGNPLGYNKTVTTGVISALNRDLNFPDEKLRLLQTDAAINPGNSGGALVNINGEVVGINTIKIADTKVEGIGFAIPINFAKPIIEELIEKGYVSRPYLGIMGKNVDEEASELYEIPIGVIVVDVMENSSAQQGGIQRGDVIISVDGTKILSMEQLSNLIKEHEAGDTIKVTIVRNGKERKEFNVKLGEKR